MLNTTHTAHRAGPRPLVIAPATPLLWRVLRGLRRLGAFLAWVLTGFGLLPALFGRRRRGAMQEVVVYSVHRAFYLWALILLGFAGSWVVDRWPGTGHVLGWVYVWTLLYTLVTLLFDMSTVKVLLWAGIFTFAWVLSAYVEHLNHVRVLSAAFGYLGGLEPRFNPGFATLLSWLLLGPWVGALFYTFTNGRKRFTPNEIAEWYIGEGSELTDRWGLKFRTRYRDVLEMILGFGAGDLLAVDNKGNVVKRYENVLFLAFQWPRLDRLLQERSTVVDTAPGDTLVVTPVRRTAEPAEAL